MPKSMSTFEFVDESYYPNGDETISEKTMTTTTNTTNNTSLTSMACLRIAEMKSIQPYSTKDEYIYAMKEDLAEWFNLMYYNQQSSTIQSLLNALNFTDELENGSLICFHANCVMKQAQLNEFTFNLNDLNMAGIVNTCSLLLSTTTASALNKNTNKTPSSKLNHLMSGEFLLYKSTARSQSFHARDNISNFIKWCRHVVKVRECLMFETDDLIMRKNEKHFILCLLEVARFGARFGMQVPTIIRYEQEIEAEIEREKQRELKHQMQIIDDDDDDDEDLDNNQETNDGEKIKINLIRSPRLGVKEIVKNLNEDDEEDLQSENKFIIKLNDEQQDCKVNEEMTLQINVEDKQQHDKQVCSHFLNLKTLKDFDIKIKLGHSQREKMKLVCKE
jgi:growth arrest-specific protein 2